jgi:prolyl-tRNA synthetase
LQAVEAIRQEVADLNIRIKADIRTEVSPGYKFNDWELKGVPVRIEVGPRDVQNATVVLARRDQPGKAGKQTITRAALRQALPALLEQIQANLLLKARQFRDANTFDVKTYDELKEAVAKGFARGWWAGSSEDEQRIQEETKATLRCLPLEQPGGSGTCLYTGKPANRIAIFGRSY